MARPGVKTPGYFQIVPSGRSDAPASFLAPKTCWTETLTRNKVKIMKQDKLQYRLSILC